MNSPRATLRPRSWLALALAAGLAPLAAHGLGGQAGEPWKAATKAAIPPDAVSETGPAASDLVKRLTLSLHPEQLDAIQMSADEAWYDHGQPQASDYETDRVIFYRSVNIESTETEKGRPLDAGALARQARARQMVERHVDAVWNGGAAAGQLINLDGEVWKLSDFTAHYDWSQAPTAPGDAEGVVRLLFRPRPDAHPRSRMERVLDLTTGNLAVDAATGQVLGGEFESLGEVKFGGGFLAHMAFRGTFTMQAVGDCWVMHEVKVEIEGRELFTRLSGTQVNTYRALPGAAAAPPALQ